MTTAAARLVELAGHGGTAGALLLAIGAGATAGAALVAYSGLASATAAEHLLTDAAAPAAGYVVGRNVPHFTPFIPILAPRKKADQQMLVAMLL